MTTHDEHFLRLAIKLADEARTLGADPFGAVLVREGVVLSQARDRSVAVSDPTYHAELAAISTYCRDREVFSLEGYTLYCSTEPCPMCAGAIHWARISRVVYSVSQAMLQGESGGRLKPSCEPIVNMGSTRVEVIGPLLPDEGLAVFKDYAWTPKIERHRALFRVPD
jgi:tRNA(adenine34) deaminase